MQHSEGSFKTYDNLSLYEQYWRPEGDIKAAVVIVHGYAEHSGRYAPTAEYLTDNGYAVYTFDLRGHGRSQGPRVLVHLFIEYLLDLKVFLDMVNKRESGKSIFMLGHSMGGTITTLFVITHRPLVSGLILSGPLLKISDKISKPLRIFTLIAGYISPKLPVVKKINHRLISSDPNVAAGYDNDPLVYRGNLLAREAREIGLAVNRVQKRMQDVLLPLLILHGTGDRLVDAEGSKQLYTCARSKDKTLKLYEGFYHEVLNETKREMVLKDVVNWLDMHT